MRKVLFILGTRPEAIKLSPLILHLKRFPDLYSVRVCVTAQHRHLLDQVLAAFRVEPDYDLNVMMPGQTLFQSTANIIRGLEDAFKNLNPDLAIVQGDTTTTFCGALAAFYSGVPVAHVEAGLRTGDLYQPFPEELNRVLTGRMATLHFAATQGAAENLASEGIVKNVMVTGNTGIDAVLFVRDGLESGALTVPAWTSPATAEQKIILVTAHRRESFGDGFVRIFQALQTLAARPDVHIIYPVHPNPNVQDPVNRYLSSHPRITLMEPLDYLPFVNIARHAHILLTDSGGIQEEGPSLGKPVLVLREKTERPEAVSAGTARLVGTDPDRIVSEVNRLLDVPEEYDRMARTHNPYGDGHASERIETGLRSFFATT